MQWRRRLYCKIISRLIMHDWRSRFKLQPISGTKSGLKHDCRFSPKNLFKKLSYFVIFIVILIIAATVIWYNIMLSPVSGLNGQVEKITIKPGTDSTQIGQLLEKQSIIRSGLAFDIYARTSGKNSVLQAGTYRLSPSETIPQIVEHFVRGDTDKLILTFYPGATLVDNSSTPIEKKQDVTTILKRDGGFSQDEISTALRINNIGPLFAGKPDNSNLEGYIYGETYNFNTNATVEEVLRTVFDEFYNVIKSENLVNRFAARGLNLYEGITLASIIQRESGNEADQRQIAQVFYSRLAQGMKLDSDVTYQYIADRDGLVRSPSLDSPYNTRKYAGLPPAPISNPGLSALLAVADPAEGSYLYFLSGDDGKTYYSYTEDEHNVNRAEHCQTKCANP